MPSRSHLTPVSITDRRGRRTTVYRSGAGNPGPAGKANVPAPATPASSATLREPKPLPTAELEKLASDITSYLVSFGLRAPDEVRPMIVTEEAGRAAAALAAEAVKGGVLTTGETYTFLIHAARQAASVNQFRPGMVGAKVGAGLARDLLLVAGRVAARHPEQGGGWTRHLIEATNGARFNRRDPLDTEAQLDSLAAVVEFTMEDRYLENFTYGSVGFGGTGELRSSKNRELSIVGSGDHRSIKNSALEELLRGRPHDLDRILTYTQGRDMDSPDAVANLRQFLHATEHNPAVGDGWL